MSESSPAASVHIPGIDLGITEEATHYIKKKIEVDQDAEMITAETIGGKKRGRRSEKARNAKTTIKQINITTKKNTTQDES